MASEAVPVDDQGRDYAAEVEWEILVALMENDVDMEVAEKVIALVAGGKIPHMMIKY